MTISIIIALCSLLLISYIFDITSSKTKIPSVVLLLLLGWTVRLLTNFFDVRLPDFSPVLPLLGSIGLILIVLEGSLEIEFNKSKYALIKKSFFGSLVPMVGLAIVIAFFFHYFGNFGLKDSFVNAIPFCVISSAIAIPSARNLSSDQREFIVYESSFSDILGVLIFNFLALNATIDVFSFLNFGLQILIITVVSFVATIALSLLLSKIEHHVKFVPIILLVILIYEISKIFHLPALIFILLFGLFIGNFDELRRFKWIEKFKPDVLNKEVQKFKELTIEATFLIRALFFLLFGYLIETAEVLNADTFIWAIGIVFLIFVFRAIQLILSRLPLRPLLFIAPRGLITILLFLSISATQSIALANRSLIIQVIVLTALIMMIGLLTNKRIKKKELL